MKHRYHYLLAAPAIAGLLFVTGCDTDDDIGDAGDVTTPTDTDRATPAAGTGMGDAAGDTATVPEADREALSQMLEDAQETAEKYKDQIEANVDIEGWGTGDAASQMLGTANEKLDAIQAAVNDGEWATVATNMRDLAAMPMPADLKQQVRAIGDKLRTLNLPALRDLPLSMPGSDTEMPTVPGVPSPGEADDTPTTRPSGGGNSVRRMLL